tara:strand:- start:342 stop:503 length:162 start_codon:yes stop_codon:yes gene_type:complete
MYTSTVDKHSLALNTLVPELGNHVGIKTWTRGDRETTIEEGDASRRTQIEGAR